LVLAAGNALIISAEHVRFIVTCDKVGWVVAAVMVQTSSVLPRWPVLCPVVPTLLLYCVLYHQ
jgi:hypothetical protein